MISNCTLYFPIEKPSLKSIFPKGRSDGGIFKSATWFEFDSGAGLVRLNLRHDDLVEHLRGFHAYVARLPNNGESRAKAQTLIKTTKAAVGVTLPSPVSTDSVIFTSLQNLLSRFGGFMFVADSIMLPDGSFLVGPMAKHDESGSSMALELRKVDPDNYKHKGPTEGVNPARIAMRERIYCMLAERGFRCARWLPLYRSDDCEDTLRPLEEVAGRLLALNALFLWVSTFEDVATTDHVLAFVDRNALHGHLTPDENAILALPRTDAHSAHAGTIGWRLENMWVLAWILGFEPAPPFFQGQIPSEITRRMIVEFLPDLDATIYDFLKTAQSRTPLEVGQQEDLYYCVHNAVRSAQMGEDSVHQDFHPVRDGGAIHERRHALTWSISPCTDWDNTDLST